jgi:hypothetical protein
MTPPTYTLATVSGLAQARRLPINFLRTHGVRDSKRGVTFPYHNLAGEEVANRVRENLETSQPTKWGRAGGPTLPYIALETMQSARELGYTVIVEGETDSLTLWHHDIPAIGIPGSSMTNVLRAEHVAGISRLYIVREPGAAGLAFVQHLVAQLSAIEWHGDVKIIDLDEIGCKDPSELHVNDPEQFDALWHIAMEDARPAPKASANGKATATNGSTNKTETPVDWGDARPWPTLSPDALYGLAGDFVRLVAPQSEADLSALLAQFLCAFGCAVGPSAHFMVEATRHTARIWAIVVGKTAGGRKGTAKDQVNRVFRIADAEWFEASQVSGLASGEGLLQRLRDRPEPIEKRVLVVESEFERTLAAIARDGSTLGAILRDLYDTDRAENLTRKDPLIAKGCHVSVIAHITPDALRAKLTSTDIANGSFNRFLPVCSKRRQRLPHGGNLTSADVAPLAKRLRIAIDFAREVREMRRTSAANAAWEKFYYAVPEPEGLLGATTARAEGQVLRLSLLYALLDGKEIVDVPHLRAAEALWDYARESAGHIFGSKLGDRVADPILKKLREAYPGSIDRDDVRSVVFSNHVDSESLTDAIANLVRRGLITSDETKTGGRPKQTLRAVPPCAESAKSAGSTSDASLSAHSALSAQSEERPESERRTNGVSNGFEF